MMRKHLLIFILFSKFLTPAFGVECILSNSMPDLDGSECQDTYALSRPFLNEDALIREGKIKNGIGDMLSSSIISSVKEIADRDIILDRLGSNLSSENGQCSLDSLKAKLSCSVDLINKNISSFSGGKVKNIDDYLGLISDEYIRNNKIEVNVNEQNCMSNAYMRDMNFSLFLEEFKDIDLKEYYATLLNKEGNLDGRYVDFSMKLKLYTWESIDQDLLEMDVTQLSGDMLEDQLKSLMGHNSNKEVISKRSEELCSDMFENMEKLLCSNVSDSYIENGDFNKTVLGYPVDLLENGFDIEELEFEEVDIESTYRSFILNCNVSGQEDDKESDSLQSIDDMINLFELSYSEMTQRDAQIKDRMNHQSIISEEEDKQICSLMNCENYQEVDQGKACQKRERPRTLSEISTSLNCPEDDQCRTPVYNAFLGTYRKFSPESSSLGLTSFGSNFVVSSRRATLAAPTVAVGEVGNVLNQTSPLSDSRSDSFSESSGNRGISSRSSTPRRERVASRSTSAKKDKPLPTAEQYFANQVKNPSAKSSGFVGNHVQKNYDNFFSNSENLTDEERDQLEKDERLAAMEVQRQTMEEMLGIMRDNVDISRQAVRSSQVSLPEIAQANRVESAPRGNSRVSDQALNAEFMANARRIKNEQEQLLAEQRRINSSANDIGGESSSAEYRPFAAPTPSSGESIVAAPAGGSVGAGAEVSAETPTRRVNDVNALLDELSNAPKESRIETTLGDISQLTTASLQESGIALNGPFVIIVKDNESEYTVPVRPSLFRGKRILTPILGQSTAGLSHYLRRSPLFKEYFAFQDAK